MTYDRVWAARDEPMVFRDSKLKGKVPPEVLIACGAQQAAGDLENRAEYEGGRDARYGRVIVRCGTERQERKNLLGGGRREFGRQHGDDIAERQNPCSVPICGGYKVARVKCNRTYAPIAILLPLIVLGCGVGRRPGDVGGYRPCDEQNDFRPYNCEHCGQGCELSGWGWIDLFICMSMR